ncbi:MAG: hypothetical protein Q8O26_11425 [Phreatobacter sp.]|uniref:hypothetical protein n=1 Tax=Phreatobacter sp. TaxID=1966341 RepID=UPI0027370988|nr:hypothetical protein [Phreatobacter sp.]MDP2802481.1 hypothetical protein [Phreatobacter sp.]
MRGGLVIAAAALAAGACSPVVAPDQLALCREVLPALHDPGTLIRESRHGPAPAGSGVRIDYLAERPGLPRTAHFATCRFEGRDPRGRPDLADLSTERGPFPGARFVILKRWWLDQAPTTPRSAGKAR